MTGSKWLQFSDPTWDEEPQQSQNSQGFENQPDRSDRSDRTHVKGLFAWNIFLCGFRLKKTCQDCQDGTLL